MAEDVGHIAAVAKQARITRDNPSRISAKFPPVSF